MKRFIAGDTLEEAMPVALDLLQRGFKVSLDYLGENTQSEAEALQAKATYIRMLDVIAEQVPPPYHGIEPLNISIKLTQCGLDQGEAFAIQNYRDVLAVAAKHDNFVRIDMEASEYTDRTVDIVTTTHKDFQNTGTVLQSYLKRTPEDVALMIDRQIRTRIVKGAYLEPPTVAFPEKAQVDQAYVTLAKQLLKSGLYPAIATQDDAIIRELNNFIDSESIDKGKFEYQMLFGIRRDLQDSLRQSGYNVRVYIPFGDSWYPYFTRRLAERPANSLFILKSLVRG